MSYLYVHEQGSNVGVKNNRIEVICKNSMTKSIPIETLDNIQVFGNINISTRCIEVCLKKGIDIIYYSTKGAYYGRLISTNHVNTYRQRKQFEIDKNKIFKLEISKKIIQAKINNQIVIMKRFSNNYKGSKEEIIIMKRMLINAKEAKDIEQLMGYEGMASKLYFSFLGKVVKSDFYFERRTKRPPEDEFNSMLSFGYSILFNEIYGKIEGKGLNPYFGIMHKDKEKHPSLASDLIEEWRAVIIDSLVMSLVNGNEISKSNFYRLDNEKIVLLDSEGFKKFIVKYDKKINTSNSYLNYINYKISYRRAIDFQINQFVKAIESEDVSLYEPIMIR